MVKTASGKPVLLDLFCGAGGAAKGYQRAGFYVVGVDNRPQPNYCGDEFVQADAMTYPLPGFDVVHASPPCQAHTSLKSMWNSKKHLDLLTPTLERFDSLTAPWVVENVMGAPMRAAIRLCGSSFGLGTGDAELRRHRYFELGRFQCFAPPCMHYSRGLVIGVYGGHGRDHRRTIGNYGDGNGRDYRKHPATVGVHRHAGGASVRDGTQQFTTAQRAEAMGIDWMTGNELSQAIPPTYTEYVGKHLIAALTR